MTIRSPVDEIAMEVQRALHEDIGTGDLTAELIPGVLNATAKILCREEAVLCGRPWVEAAFGQVDRAIRLAWHAEDGARLHAGMVVCEIHGPARGIVTAERTALNFLQVLSGTATHARRYADAVSGLPVKLLDTRKTLPGLRAAQKYAVRCGGCENHRQGLFDAMLIKENHIAAAGGLTPAVERARALHADKLLEVEVENLEQLREALALKPDRILLDNFNIDDLQQAARIAGRAVPLEASGNITLENIRSVAATGIDYISLGSLTKHVRAVDYSLLFKR
ncbi:MAG TPA: carboxylating nicotinate-nucleotide diphosphorylase [Gammaproteobacteria bacterium]|nr:carboxylating nicotinate-nucleotide diphosphorylase [Gammaproteobacteria bacterium]